MQELVSAFAFLFNVVYSRHTLAILNSMLIVWRHYGNSERSCGVQYGSIGYFFPKIWKLLLFSLSLQLK